MAGDDNAFVLIEGIRPRNFPSLRKKRERLGHPPVSELVDISVVVIAHVKVIAQAENGRR